MGLFSSFTKRRGEPAAVGEPVDEVQRARRRARQRLIGAVVLLTIGVVGFPLVFETQPRPIPVDIPIEIPRKDGLPPLLAPPPARPNPSPLASAPSSSNDNPAAVPAPPADVITESREEAGRDAPTVHAPAPPAADSAASRPAVKAATRPEVVARPLPKPEAGDDGARARALLDGKAGAGNDATTAAARFIVQVGAFADANAAHDTRLKIEKLGMKTYTQFASTPAGNRIRVRVGPFPTRDEADKALAKARSAGLSAVLLTL